MQIPPGSLPFKINDAPVDRRQDAGNLRGPAPRRFLVDIFQTGSESLDNQQRFIDAWQALERSGAAGFVVTEPELSDDGTELSGFVGVTVDRLTIGSLWVKGDESKLDVASYRLSDVSKVQSMGHNWAVTIEDPSEGRYEVTIPEHTATALMLGYDAERTLTSTDGHPQGAVDEVCKSLGSVVGLLEVMRTRQYDQHEELHGTVLEVAASLSRIEDILLGKP